MTKQARLDLETGEPAPPREKPRLRLVWVDCAVCTDSPGPGKHISQEQAEARAAAMAEAAGFVRFRSPKLAQDSWICPECAAALELVRARASEA